MNISKRKMLKKESKNKNTCENTFLNQNWILKSSLVSSVKRENQEKMLTIGLKMS